MAPHSAVKMQAVYCRGQASDFGYYRCVTAWRFINKSSEDYLVTKYTVDMYMFLTIRAL